MGLLWASLAKRAVIEPSEIPKTPQRCSIADLGFPDLTTDGFYEDIDPMALSHPVFSAIADVAHLACLLSRRLFWIATTRLNAG
jgi:hypothetical protein